MAGLTTHLLIASVGFLVGYFIFKEFLYGASFFIGHLIPDALKFGITGVKLWTAHPSIITQDNLFRRIDLIASDYNTWIILGIFVIALSFFLYHIHKIRKNKMQDINKTYFFFLAGVFIHLIVDILIIEKSYWI